MRRELSLAIERTPDTLSETVTETLSLDEEAFKEFYARTSRPLWSYISRISQEPTLADDLTQETYLRFLQARLREVDEAARKQYLFRIATNLLVDHFRSVKRRHMEQPEMPLGEDPTEGIGFRSVFSSTFQGLNPRERQLMWLAYIEGFNHTEIAEVQNGSLTLLAAGLLMVLLFMLFGLYLVWAAA